MKPIKLILSLMLLVILSSSCKWDKKNSGTDTPLSAPIAITMDSIYKSGPKVITQNDTSYSYVLLEFPKSLGLGKADDAIIREIKKRQFENFYSFINPEENNPKPLNIDAAIDQFIKSSEVDSKERDGLFFGYYYESFIDTNFLGNEVISLIMGDNFFTGGAHPNSYMTYLNFERNSGTLIEVEKLIQDTTAMKVVVEKSFYESEKKELGQDYDEKNYFFGEKFALPQNYAITKQGLKCLYNPYEAAAYVRGPIVFTIPWKDLNGIITKYVPLDDIKLGDSLQ